MAYLKLKNSIEKLFTKVYNIFMSLLLQSIFSESRFSVLRTLTSTNRERGIREIADLNELSPRGAKVVLESLVREGLAQRLKNGKFRSSLSKEDERLLKMLISTSENNDLQERAELLSKKRNDVLDWIPKTLDQLKALKKKYQAKAEAQSLKLHRVEIVKQRRQRARVKETHAQRALEHAPSRLQTTRHGRRRPRWQILLRH